MKSFSLHTLEIEKRIQRAKRVFYLFDFDGTLAPIQQHPDQAFMSREVRSLLKKIAQNKNTRLGFVSGRSLKNLKNLVKMKSVFYAGNHGLEAEGLGKKFIFKMTLQQTKMIALLSRDIHRVFKDFSGVVIQDKKYTLSIHYRMVALKQRKIVEKMVRRLLQPWIKQKQIILKKGKMVFEIYPMIQWDKGSIVLWFLKKEKIDFNKDLVFYVGDDKTDEDAFAVLDNQITIRVGKKASSKAKFYFNNITEVFSFLERIAR